MIAIIISVKITKINKSKKAFSGNFVITFGHLSSDTHPDELGIIYLSEKESKQTYFKN